MKEKKKGAWLYGVHRTCPETAAVPRGTSHVTTKQHCNHFSGYSKLVQSHTTRAQTHRTELQLPLWSAYGSCRDEALNRCSYKQIPMQKCETFFFSFFVAFFLRFFTNVYKTIIAGRKFVKRLVNHDRTYHGDNNNSNQRRKKHIRPDFNRSQ